MLNNRYRCRYKYDVLKTWVSLMAHKRAPSPVREQGPVLPDLPKPGDRDPINPKSLESLCSAFEVTVEELQLPCVFCKRHLAPEELRTFCERQFRVVWRSGFPFGACWACTFTRGREQSWRHHHFSAFAPTVEVDTGVPLGDLLIRCTVCLRPTTYLEKLAVVSRGGRFHKISEQWRGYCYNCIDMPEEVIRI